jgi:hypothetical protein
VIAEAVRLRRDLPVVDTATDLTRELALLTAHRADLIADWVRMIKPAPRRHDQRLPPG